MYERVKAFILSLVKVPAEPLDPMGDVRTLRVFRAAPGYLRYLTVGWLLSQVTLMAGLLFVPVAILVAGIDLGRARVVLLAGEVLAATFFVAQATVTYFLLRLNYELRWYKVTDRSLRIRAGVMNVRETTMTFANVQNVTVTQGPLERLFGISDVRVETAGGGGDSGSHGQGSGLGGNLHIGVFRGVDNPEAIRDLMLERLRRLRDSGLGDPDEAHDAAAPSRVVALGEGPEVLNLLAALRDEARALRRASEGAAAIGGTAS